MKANQDECHFLLSLNISIKFLLLACILENSDSQKLLGVTIDRKLFLRNKLPTNVISQTEKFKHSQEFSHIYNPKTKTTFHE